MHFAVYHYQWPCYKKPSTHATEKMRRLRINCNWSREDTVHSPRSFRIGAPFYVPLVLPRESKRGDRHGPFGPLTPRAQLASSRCALAAWRSAVGGAGALHGTGPA